MEICLDFDETLASTQYKYNEPIWRAGLLITKAVGSRCMHPAELMKLQQEIDAGLVAEYGLQATRFPESFVKTYEAAAERAGVPVDSALAAQLRNIGNRFQYGPFPLFPDASPVLKTLRQSGHRLHLITAGDKKLQTRKIVQSGVSRFVDSVHITDLDKKSALQMIAGDEPWRAVMVGDSKKSDIAPAIALGMHAVWIPSNTWSFAHTDVDAEKHHTITSIRELPPLIAALAER